MSRTCRAAIARRWAAVLVLLAASGMTAVPAAAATTYNVTATIGVGSGPGGVAVNPVTNTIYVTNTNGFTALHD